MAMTFAMAMASPGHTALLTAPATAARPALLMVLNKAINDMQDQGQEGPSEDQTPPILS